MNGFSDLAFFALVVKSGSLASAAQQMGVTPPAASKRLAAIEQRLGVRLMQRTTRRLSLTPEGETYLVDGAHVLEELEQLERTIAGGRAAPRGLLRVSATLGFGRRHIAPALSRFVRLHPEVEAQLHLTDRPVNLVEQGFDLLVHFGSLPDVRLSTRLLAHNQRVLCAAPKYLKRAGLPSSPHDLVKHSCIFIREGDETFGTWHLSNGARQETVKVRGTLSSNDGESATGWALDGHGILMRSLWEAAPYLASGRLKPVLPDWHLPPADIVAVFVTRSQMAAKTRALIDFLVEEFKGHRLEEADSAAAW